MLDQIQQPQRLRAVERKALPHFSEEADVKPFRMTEKILWRRGGVGHRFAILAWTPEYRRRCRVHRAEEVPSVRYRRWRLLSASEIQRQLVRAVRSEAHKAE